MLPWVLIQLPKDNFDPLTKTYLYELFTTEI